MAKPSALLNCRSSFTGIGINDRYCELPVLRFELEALRLLASWSAQTGVGVMQNMPIEVLSSC